PSTVGQAVTFTATVTGGTTTPGGSVQFAEGATALGTGSLRAEERRAGTTTAPTQGDHLLTAQFAGDATRAGSTFSSLTQTGNAVLPAPTAPTLTLNLNPSTVGQGVTFTATVTGGTTNPGGSVQFAEGATALGTGSL